MRCASHQRTCKSPRRALYLLASAVLLAALMPALSAAYLSTGPSADRNWFWQNQSPQGNGLRSMSWIGASDGWAVGAAGTVLRTTDGGMTWSVQDPQTARDLTGVSFVSTSNGWAVGLSGTIRSTSDGGSSWATQTVGTSASFRSVSFANANIGVAVGDQGTSTSTIQFTSNGGVTWRAAATTSTVGLTSVHMVSATTGWAVGGAGVILRTVDGGASWTVRPSPTVAGLAAIEFEPNGVVGYFVGNAEPPNWTIFKTTDSGATWTAVSGLGATGAINLFGVDVFDANNAITVGSNGQIRRTTDGGVTWANQSQNNVAATILRSVKLLDGANAYAVGDLGMMCYTRNGGESWFSLLQGSSARWQAVHFPDANNGWAVGQNGAIMRTADAGRTWEHQSAGISTWRAVYFANATTGWLAGDGGVIKKTTNGVDWQTQASGTTQQLNGLWFTSPTTGFAVGNSGVILKTINGGATWVAKPAKTGSSLNAVWFANATTGFAVGSSGTIRKTIDGGETWASTSPGSGQTLLAVSGISPTNVWVSGTSNTLFRTTTGDTPWISLDPGVGTNPVRTVNFVSATTGWIASNFGIVRKTTDGGATWTSQNAGMPTSLLDPAVGIHGAWFVNANTGYLVGDTGIVRRTLNGGTDWASLQYGTLNALNCVVFPDANNGWASGGNGTMMRTSNGGRIWTRQQTGATSSLNEVWMTNALSGWAVGDNGTIRRTTDGGLTWTGQPSGVTVNLSSVGSGDTSRAIVAGQGVVRYTMDAGSTWTSASVPPTQPVTGLYMIDANNAWAVSTRVSGNNVVWRSVNGGATWTSQTTTANANLWDVYFRDANVGYAVGDSGVILKTVDGGVNWIRRPTPTTLPFYWIRFSDANTGLAVGGGGVIARTTDGGTTWSLQSSGTNQALNAVAFSGTGRASIVGGSGMILTNQNSAAPVTTLSVDPIAPNGTNGWYSGFAPLLTLSANEPATSYYGWASAAGPFSTYAAPFPALEGTRTLYFFSVATDGTTELVRNRVLKTDVTTPTAPTAVTPTLVSTSTATIEWSPAIDSVSGVDRYEILIDEVYAASSGSTSVLLTGLTPNTFYSVTVRAVDRAGNVSALSAPTSFLTNAVDTAPYTTVLSANPLEPDGANGWYVTTPTVTLASLPMVGGLRTTYYSWIGPQGPYSEYTTTLTPQAGAATLYYSTHDSDTPPVRSNEPTRSHLFKLDTETPSAPSITASATAYNSVHLSWAPVTATPSGIARYDVYVNGVLHSSLSTTVIDIVGLTQSTTYSFVVRAVNAAGTVSPPSATVTVTTPVAPAPSPPSLVLALAPSGDSVYLNWLPSHDVEGAAFYRIWRSSDAVNYSVVATTTGSVYDCAFIDRGLRSSTRYWYAVSTVDYRGESSLSSTATAVWPYIAPVTTRADRILGVGATGSNNAVHLSWQASSNPAVVGYMVRRGSSSLSAMTTLTPIPIPAAGYFDLTVVNGEKYYYHVAAVDASGVVGSPSVDLLAKPIAPKPENQPHPHDFGNESACICHATHSSTALRPLIRFPGAEKNTVCQSCHAPTVSYDEFSDPLLKSKHPQGQSVTESEPYSCVTCHVPLIPDGEPMNNLMRVNSSSPCVVVTDTPAGNGFCYSCHGPGSELVQGDLTFFETSAHRAVVPPPTGANITCNTCHESHTSRNSSLLYYEGLMVCMQCHTASATNPNQIDILSRLTMNEGANLKHPLLPQDQVAGARMSCQNCHNTHAATDDFPLVEPHDPSPSGTWTSDEKAFCFECHDGEPLPTSVETSPWAGPVLSRSAQTTTTNTKAAYAVNVHGFGSRSGSTTTTAHLRPDMGYSYGTVLECNACHDPHGTANDGAIADTVISAGGGHRIDGVITYRIDAHRRDLRFFCNTCHIWDSASHDSRAGTSTVVFPMNCRACHGHGAGSPPGGNF